MSSFSRQLSENLSRGGNGPVPGNMTLGAGGGNGTTPMTTTAYGTDSMVAEILSICWAMTALSGLFLGARVYVKCTAHRGLWWDDHFLLASWFMLAAFSASTTYATTVGLGYHNGSVPTQDNTEGKTSLQLMVIIATVFSVLGAAWSKTSFALTLLRITKRTVYWVVWIVIVSLNLILTFNAIIQFIWCAPAAAAWTTEVRGDCWDRAVSVDYTIFAAAYSAGMDIILAVIPWTIILRLKMEPKERIGVAVCMSLGFIAGITSIVRAVKVPSLQAQDYTYDSGSLFIWTGAEIATTIIAASIPVLRALLRDIVSSAYNRNHTTPLNTFKNGTFRSNKGTHTTIITSTSGNQRGGNGGGGGLTHVTELGESVTSLINIPPDVRNRNYQGGILKTEVITVNYDLRQGSSQRSDTFDSVQIPLEKEHSGNWV